MSYPMPCVSTLELRASFCECLGSWPQICWVSRSLTVLSVYGVLIVHGTQENYPGIYLEFSTYHSTFPSDAPSPQPSPPPLAAVPPPTPSPGLNDSPKERFLDIIVDFALQNITAEFPSVSYIALVHICGVCYSQCVAVP